MLYGAIIGDIVGSVYEFHNLRSKNFTFMTDRCYITDDSCMTIALASAIKQWKEKGGDLSQIAAESMRLVGNRYPDKGYGGMFWQWLRDPDMGPYNSWGNGAAMRISAAGYLGESITEVKRLSYMVTSVTHDHIEGIKGAEAVAVAIFIARNGHSKDDIAEYIRNNYYPTCDCLADLQEYYDWDSSCQGTVPPALQCFFESTDFEDAIRNAISIGGDSDTEVEKVKKFWLRTKRNRLRIETNKVEKRILLFSIHKSSGLETAISLPAYVSDDCVINLGTVGAFYDAVEQL